MTAPSIRTTAPGHSDTQRSPWLRRVLSAGLVAASIPVAALLSATPAHATLTSTQGVFGGIAGSATTCSYYNLTGRLVTDTSTPVVYAADSTPGAGNDWQQVRYRVLWYDASTGNVRSTSDWSGFLWAGDAQSAVWSGTTSVTWRYDDAIAVGTEVQFYNGTTGELEGVVSDIAATYQNVQEGQTAGVSDGRCVTAWGRVS
jgi:hypothetical protein